MSSPTSKSVTYPALRGCPYCGATPDARVVHTDQGDGQMEDCTMVVCDFRIGGCGASGPNRMDPAEAIAGWNRRAEYWKDELTAANAEIERLREKLSGETSAAGADEADSTLFLATETCRVHRILGHDFAEPVVLRHGDRIVARVVRSAPTTCGTCKQQIRPDPLTGTTCSCAAPTTGAKQP